GAWRHCSRERTRTRSVPWHSDAQDEIFGPVLSILPYGDEEEEAISIANDTTYGLQGYVFSADVQRALRVAAQMEVGRVQVNALAHDPLALSEVSSSLGSAARAVSTGSKHSSSRKLS